MGPRPGQWEIGHHQHHRQAPLQQGRRQQVRALPNQHHRPFHRDWFRQTLRFGVGRTTTGQPARWIITCRRSGKARRGRSVPQSEEGQLGEQLHNETILLKRGSASAGQPEPEHTLCIASEAEAEALLDGQQPGNGTAGVGTGVAPEAVEGLTASDTGIDRAPIRGKDLPFSMREPPAPQRESEGMTRGIRERDAQGDRFQQANGGQDVLGPVVEGVDFRVGFPCCAVCGIIVAIDGLDHPDEAIGIGGASYDSDTMGAGQTDSGSAVAGLITAKELGRAEEDDGCVRSQSRRVGQGFRP